MQRCLLALLSAGLIGWLPSSVRAARPLNQSRSLAHQVKHISLGTPPLQVQVYKMVPAGHVPVVHLPLQQHRIGVGPGAGRETSLDTRAGLIEARASLRPVNTCWYFCLVLYTDASALNPGRRTAYLLCSW